MKASISFILMLRMSLWCRVMKRKEIIIWIRVYPNWQMKIDSKIRWEEKFFLWNQSMNSFVQIRRKSLQCPILKKKKRRLLHESVFIPIDKWTLVVKNGRKWSFSYETKASISFIQMRRMSLWCQIMERKDIIMWIRVYPN